MDASAVVPVEGGVNLSVRVQPKASRDALRLETDGRVRVSLTAPPVDGEANGALLRFLAGVLQVRRHQLSLRSGERGRDKVVFVHDGNPESVRACLERYRS